MTDALTDAAQTVEESRAQMRADVAPEGTAYVAQLVDTCEAERRWAQDPDRDDLADAAKAARKALDDARAAFDTRRASALGAHTKRVNEALAALEVG